MLKNYPIFNNCYDLAVAYAGPMDFISNKIKSRKKVQWIHFDINLTLIRLDLVKILHKILILDLIEFLLYPVKVKNVR